MSRQWKGFLSGIIVTLIFVALIGSAAASVGRQTAQLDFNNIKVTLDGKSIPLVDANGTAVEPFAINGTTYLPVRAVADALGLGVGWDQSTTTVILTNKAVTPAPSQEPVTSHRIYVTATGSKYHYDPTCNGGTYYESTLEQALSRGLTPCAKCVK